jgi:hypothetical protein
MLFRASALGKKNDAAPASTVLFDLYTIYLAALNDKILLVQVLTSEIIIPFM